MGAAAPTDPGCPFAHAATAAEARTEGRSAGRPVPQVDALQPRARRDTRDPASLRDRLAVDLLQVAGEVDGRRAADEAAHRERVDRCARVLEGANPVGREAARNDDLDVLE